MVTTLYQSAALGHRNRFADVVPAMAKADLNKVEQARKARIGHVVARVFELAGTTQKEAAALLGHAGSAQVSRWITGTERPQFDAIEAVPRFQQPLLLAWAELVHEGVAITTQISVTRRLG